MKILLFLQVGGHTHIARGSSSTACQCSLPPLLSLFRGNPVRVRCGDNLTWTQNIHFYSSELRTNTTQLLVSLSGKISVICHKFVNIKDKYYMKYSILYHSSWCFPASQCLKNMHHFLPPVAVFIYMCTLCMSLCA